MEASIRWLLSRSSTVLSLAVTCTRYIASSTEPTLAAIMHRQSIQPIKPKIIPGMLRRRFGLFFFLAGAVPSAGAVFAPVVESWRF